MRYLLVFLCFFGMGVVKAQYNLQSDSLFFKGQSGLYQKWLEKSGLGQVMEVNALEILPSRLLLTLSMTCLPEVAWAEWEQLKIDYSHNNAISLEQELFYKLIHFMEVDQYQGIIRVLNVVNGVRNNCFFIEIKFDPNEKRVKFNTRYCKSKERRIEVEPHRLEGLNNMSFEEINKIYNRNSVFEAIFKYAQSRYGRSKCEDRFPEVRELERGQLLRFVVVDLCKEVLKDESNPWICKVLQRFRYQCNWIKRERLEFTITFEQTAEEIIRIGVKVDGKYGSGYYDQVKRGGYHDMDLDFDEYLVDYADEIANEFKKVVLKIAKNP